MATVNLNGVQLFYELSGTGEIPLVFVQGPGCRTTTGISSALTAQRATKISCRTSCLSPSRSLRLEPVPVSFCDAHKVSWSARYLPS